MKLEVVTAIGWLVGPDADGIDVGSEYKASRGLGRDLTVLLKSEVRDTLLGCRVQEGSVTLTRSRLGRTRLFFLLFVVFGGRRTELSVRLLLQILSFFYLVGVAGLCLQWSRPLVQLVSRVVQKTNDVVHFVANVGGFPSRRQERGGRCRV